MLVHHHNGLYCHLTLHGVGDEAVALGSLDELERFLPVRFVCHRDGGLDVDARHEEALLDLVQDAVRLALVAEEGELRPLGEGEEGGHQADLGGCRVEVLGRPDALVSTGEVRRGRHFNGGQSFARERCSLLLRPFNGGGIGMLLAHHLLLVAKGYSQKVEVG